MSCFQDFHFEDKGWETLKCQYLAFKVEEKKYFFKILFCKKSGKNSQSQDMKFLLVSYKPCKLLLHGERMRT